MDYERIEIIETDEYDDPESTNRNPRRLAPKEHSQFLHSIGFQFVQEPNAITIKRKQFVFLSTSGANFSFVACGWDCISIAAETAVQLTKQHDALWEGGAGRLNHYSKILALIESLDTKCGIYMSGYPTQAVWKREQEIKKLGAGLNTLLSAPKRKGL